MKVNVELEGKSLTAGLNFYGETYADEIVVRKIGELSMVLEDVLFDLRKLSYQVENRNEDSAKSIKKRLNQLENDLDIKLNFEEDQE